MTITDEALGLLTQLPVQWSVNLKESLPWITVKSWILVPYKLWIVYFSGYHKWIELVSVIPTNTLSSFWLKFNFIMFDQGALFDFNKLILVIFLTSHMLFFLRILAVASFGVSFVLPFRFFNGVQHKFVSRLNSLN